MKLMINGEKMIITIGIDIDELDMKKAIAKGWNKRFNEDLTHKDIAEVSNKDDILCAIPYIDNDDMNIHIEVNKED